MPCPGKILRKVKRQYPHYSKRRQMKIAWGIVHKLRRKKHRKRRKR